MNRAVCVLRRSHHITPVIYAGRSIRRGVLLVAECPEILGRTIPFPEHGVQPGYMCRRQALGSAGARRTNRLAEVIDTHAEGDGVPLKWGEYMDLTIRVPLDRLVTEDLRRGSRAAGGVANAIFRPADHLAQIVNPKSVRIAAAGQIGERRQFAVTPDGTTAHQVRPESAEIFLVRIGRGKLRADRGLPIKVRPIRPTVGAAEGAK